MVLNKLRNGLQGFEHFTFFRRFTESDLQEPCIFMTISTDILDSCFETATNFKTDLYVFIQI